MKPSDDLIQLAQELAITDLVKYAAKVWKIPYNKALLKFKHMQLYNDIMTITEPLVAAYPIGALKEMFKAELRGDMQTYKEWYCNY